MRTRIGKNGKNGRKSPFCPQMARMARMARMVGSGKNTDNLHLVRKIVARAPAPCGPVPGSCTLPQPQPHDAPARFHVTVLSRSQTARSDLLALSVPIGSLVLGVAHRYVRARSAYAVLSVLPTRSVASVPLRTCRLASDCRCSSRSWLASERRYPLSLTARSQRTVQSDALARSRSPGALRNNGSLRMVGAPCWLSTRWIDTVLSAFMARSSGTALSPPTARSRDLVLSLEPAHSIATVPMSTRGSLPSHRCSRSRRLAL